MASIAVSATQSRVIKITEMSELKAPLSDAYNAGTAVRIGTDGRWVAAAAGTAAAGLAPVFLLNNTGVEGATVTGYNRCDFDLGPEALDGAAIGAHVYLSNTAGQLTLVAAESTTARIIGTVQPLFHVASNTPNLILRVTE